MFNETKDKFKNKSPSFVYHSDKFQILIGTLSGDDRTSLTHGFISYSIIYNLNQMTKNFPPVNTLLLSQGKNSSYLASVVFL